MPTQMRRRMGADVRAAAAVTAARTAQREAPVHYTAASVTRGAVTRAVMATWPPARSTRC